MKIKITEQIWNMQKNIVSSNETRVALTGLHICTAENYVEATNGHIMARNGLIYDNGDDGGGEVNIDMVVKLPKSLSGAMCRKGASMDLETLEIETVSGGTHKATKIDVLYPNVDKVKPSEKTGVYRIAINAESLLHVAKSLESLSERGKDTQHIILTFQEKNLHAIHIKALNPLMIDEGLIMPLRILEENERKRKTGKRKKA